MNEQARLISIANECISDLSKENKEEEQQRLWRRLIATAQKGLKAVSGIDKKVERLLKEAGFE